MNAELRQQLVGGGVTAEAFVGFSSDELANPRLRLANHRLDKALLAEAVSREESGAKTDGLFTCPKCQGKKCLHFPDRKAQGGRKQ